MSGAFTARENLWLSPAELAAMDLPGLSPRRNRVVEMASAWTEQYGRGGEPLWRKRQGRGGGFEYHHSVLPTVTVQALIARGLLKGASEASEAPAKAANDASAWSWFDAQTDAVKAEAQARLKAVQAVETQATAGLSRSAAVALVAHLHSVSAATLWGWLKMVQRLHAANWLPALAPRRRGGGARTDMDERLLTYFKSFYLRPSPVGYAESHRRTVEYAQTIGIDPADVPCCKKFQRELERTIPKRVQVLKRRGMDAVIETIPAQKRTRVGLSAMEAVNIDGHKWDVFVRWPGGRIGRPISVVIQDLYSNRILAWRTGDTESAILTRLAFADLLKLHGVPVHCTLDNGRAFASKWITGGALSRYRNKIKAEEPLGLLTLLGIKTHWAKPGHGQAKPIERCFGDLEQSVAGDPRCQGAWTGKKPTAKPEDYATKAVEYAVFEQLVDRAVAEYNARQGRRTEMAKGRSFDQVFQASIGAGAIVTRASPEQLRLALLTAENVRSDRKTGRVTLFGNSYYAPELYDLSGQMVTVRFDPDHLHGDVHVYTTDGRFVATAPVETAVGFYDAQGAKDRARLEGDLRKATRAAAELQGLISAAELAAQVPLPGSDKPATAPVVIRPLRSRTAAALAQAPAADAISFTDRFMRAVEALEPEEARRNFRILDGGLRTDPEAESLKK